MRWHLESAFDLRKEGPCTTLARETGRPDCYSQHRAVAFRERVGVVLKDPNRPEPAQHLVQACIPIFGLLRIIFRTMSLYSGVTSLLCVDERKRPLADVLFQQLLRRIRAKRRPAAS